MTPRSQSQLSTVLLPGGGGGGKENLVSQPSSNATAAYPSTITSIMRQILS